jgi:hypothetical protein
MIGMKPGTDLQVASDAEGGVPGASSRASEPDLKALSGTVRALQLTAAKPLLRKFVALLATRLISKKVTSSADLKEPKGMRTAAAVAGPTRQALQKLVTAAAAAAAAAPPITLSITNLAEAFDKNYLQRNGEKLCGNEQDLACSLLSTSADGEHVNDNGRLADLAEELVNIGALDVLKQSMPMETLILQHYEQLL